NCLPLSADVYLASVVFGLAMEDGGTLKIKWRGAGSIAFRLAPIGVGLSFAALQHDIQIVLALCCVFIGRFTCDLCDAARGAALPNRRAPGFALCIMLPDNFGPMPSRFYWLIIDQSLNSSSVCFDLNALPSELGQLFRRSRMLP